MFKLSKFSASAGLVALFASVFAGAAVPANAATATINAVSFKAPVFDSYDHATGGGTWNDGSVTWDKGELLGTNYKCGDIATFLFEFNTSATPTKQPAPYKAEVALTYTWDATGQSGASLTPLTDTNHLKVNTGVIRNAAGTVIGGATGTVPANVPVGYDSGFNQAGLAATVATSPAPVVTGNTQANTYGEFSSGATKTVTFTVQSINAGANIVVRSDAVIHCQPGATPTGNMQAALTSVNVTYPGAPEAISAGNQTVNFRGVGNLGGLGASMTVTKGISSNGIDCSSTVSNKSVALNASVLYCYTVSNTGNIDLTNVALIDDSATVATTDDRQIALSYNGATAVYPLPSLPAGTSATYPTASGSTSYAYSSTGIKTNTVTGTASYNGGTLTRTATATVTVGGTTPDLSLTKTQTSGNPSQAGDVITYNLVMVNNTGNSSNATVTDSNASSLTCGGVTTTAPAGTYGRTLTQVDVGAAVGTVTTCTATHIVSASDVQTGSVLNSFTAAKQSATYTSNNVTTPIVTRPVTYDLSVTKTQTSTAKPKAVGEIITYSIQATNIGTGTLTNVYLHENLAGATLSNCAYVGGSAIGTPPVSAGTAIASMASGVSFTCVASYTIIQADVTAQSVTNDVRATSTGSTTFNTDSNSVNTPIAATPSIKILKIQATGSNASTGQYPSAVGQILTYGITVTNDGNVDLTGVVVSDPNSVNGSNVSTLVCLSPNAAATTTGVALAVGQSFDCTASHTVTATDLTNGTISNIAYATGNPVGGGSAVTGQSANITTVAALSIVKEVTNVTNGTSATSGDTITYRITVKNTGEVTLTGIVVADTNSTGVTCPQTTLAAGASMACTATHVATLAEATAGHSYNTATVTTTQIPAPISSNRTDTPLLAPTAPHVSIVKTRTSAAPVNEGDTVTYSVVVTSDGVVSSSASVTAITDPNATLSACANGATAYALPLASPVSLSSGQSITCTATHVVTSADIRFGSVSNTAHVDATNTITNDLSTNSNTVTDPLTETKSLGL